jgi:hypothetical protein
MRWRDVSHSSTSLLRSALPAQPVDVTLSNSLIRQYFPERTDLPVTSLSFCTSCSERVYITAIGCETGLSGARGLQAAGAGGL